MKMKQTIAFALYCLLGTIGFLGLPWVIPSSEFSRETHLSIASTLFGLLNLLVLILLVQDLVVQIKKKKSKPPVI